jgi:hypothetical protein
MAKAPTLKSVVDKVMKSRGKKKYYFAYGTGKRTDGKPYDGALKIGVGGPGKPKKADIEAECACTQFFEGTCWSSADGETVFFRGKGKAVPPATIAKMAFTANRVASKQYDFQAPSAAEEERSDALPEGDAEDEAGEAENEETPGGEVPAGGMAAWRAARAEAVGQLAQVRDAIKAVEHEGSERAVILLESVIKNLTPEPADRRSVDELVRYLETDDVIDRVHTPNPFDIEVNFRDNLLSVLATLRDRLPE